jgi:ATP-dependent Lon protease
LKIIPVSHVDQVLEHALVTMPTSVTWTDEDQLAAIPDYQAPVKATDPATDGTVRH